LNKSYEENFPIYTFLSSIANHLTLTSNTGLYESTLYTILKPFFVIFFVYVYNAIGFGLLKLYDTWDNNTYGIFLNGFLNVI
jgi:hypothetical protein